MVTLDLQRRFPDRIVGLPGSGSFVATGGMWRPESHFYGVVIVAMSRALQQGDVRKARRVARILQSFSWQVLDFNICWQEFYDFAMGIHDAVEQQAGVSSQPDDDDESTESS